MQIKTSELGEREMKKKYYLINNLHTISYLRCTLLAIFILFCNLCCIPMVAQNEMQLSGFSNTPTILNPASAGNIGSIKAMGIYRKQWVGFENSPSTTVLGIDSEVKFLKSFHGIGAMVVYDQIGVFTNMLINANYSYHIELDKGLLGLGARVGVVNVAFNPSELHATVAGMENDYHQESDEAIQGEDDSATQLDVGLGAYFQSKKSVLSLSVLHISSPKIEMKSGAEITYKPVITFGASRQIIQKNNWRAETTLNAKTDFSSFQMEMNLAATIKDKVYSAIGYRIQDAIFFQVGANLSNGLFVGYNYDLNISKLHKYNSGTHEIAVTYRFDINVEKRNKRYKSVRIL